MSRFWIALTMLLTAPTLASAQQSLTRDHNVTVISTVPAIAG
jgi:hypothetical protein